MTVQTPQYLEDKVYSARVDRQMLSDMLTSGVKSAADLLVTATAGVNSVSVAGGVSYVQGTQSANQGLYRVFNDAAILLTHNPANANPRIDQIIVRVKDYAEDNTVLSGGSIEIVQGAETAGATLTNRSGAAVIPANSLRLADVLVAVGITNVIGPTSIQDRRTISSPLVGPEIGSIVSYAGSVEPTNGIWVAADGRLVDRLLYATFFTRVGHAYNGNVDPGNNKVRIPDKRGRSSIGAVNFGSAAGAGANDNYHVQATRGTSGGESTHTTTIAEMPVHAHGTGDSSNFIRDSGGSPNIAGSLPGSGSNYQAAATTGNAGSGTAHNNIHPYEADLFLVRIA